MLAFRRIRLRDGALRWGCIHDVAHSGRSMEVFLVESPSEHLGQHGRLTVQDRAVVERVRRFHRGEVPPPASHVIATRLWHVAQPERNA